MLPVFVKPDPPKPIQSAGLSAGLVENFDDAQSKAKEACGVCPLCKNNHTYRKRDGVLWPTDRLLKCKKFQKMNIQQRASAVERINRCPRCTS